MVEFKDFGAGLFNLLVGPAVAALFSVLAVAFSFVALTAREEWLAKRHNRLRCEEETAKK